MHVVQNGKNEYFIVLSFPNLFTLFLNSDIQL